MDKIIIRDLAVNCIIGINNEERTVKQEVIINVVISVDLSNAGCTDDFSDTIDYRALKRRIYDMVSSSSYNLIEALAEKIAALCLADERAISVSVTVDKPGALSKARSVAVELLRKRS